MNAIEILFLVLFLLIGVYFLVAWLLFRYAIVRSAREDRVKPDQVHYAPLIPYQDECLASIRWFYEQQPEAVSIRSYDGLMLRGYYLEHPNAKATLVLAHGYRGSWASDFSCVFPFYYEQGYSILAFWQRAHGDSEGEHICFGVKERFDCRDWVKYVDSRTPEGHPVFLDGISMGGSTVLMAAGLEDLPDCVKGVIADSGFTSAWDQFENMLRGAHVPVHPLMDTVNWISRKVAGFDFKECSTLDVVKSMKLPLLLVHGEADDFVPVRFSHENYEACVSEKYLVTVPGAVHGMGYLTDQEKCQKMLIRFIESHR